MAKIDSIISLMMTVIHTQPLPTMVAEVLLAVSKLWDRRVPSYQTG
jgi:hypothetical protein